MNVVAIIQARMGSTRLPGKVLLDLIGTPMFAHVVERCRRASTLNQVVVATTDQPADNAIIGLCDKYNWQWFRGSEEDVLDRYYQVARICKANVVVRVTSDCPLIEPEIIDMVVQALLDEQTRDYTSNTLPPRNFPRGLDVEAMTFATLEQAWRDDHNPTWREHVTPYIYRHPELFTLHAVSSYQDYSHMRWTVDTVEDLAFVCKVFEYFGHNAFSWQDVLVLLEQNPFWLDINRSVEQKQIL